MFARATRLVPALLLLVGPALADPVPFKPGLWEGVLTVSTDAFLDETPLWQCFAQDGLSSDEILSMVEPQGQCELQSEAASDTGVSYEAFCTGGTVSTASVNVVTEEGKLSVGADVVFDLGEGLLIPGLVLVNLSRTGDCPAE
ncbi:MAG TPA: hypothetical protein PK417_00085 [Hyphomonas sp.]|nr:hypothetical protein [Hyphomonas sp.]HRX72810.1 hypothetical protein [Hyphomonas sp.]